MAGVRVEDAAEVLQFARQAVNGVGLLFERQDAAGLRAAALVVESWRTVGNIRWRPAWNRDSIRSLPEFAQSNRAAAPGIWEDR
ncbi:MAG: hypothetical protein ABMA26_07640 [Limisphaerales bacterium]